MANTPDIKYLNKDFNSFKDALIDFAKYYFPNTVNDFSDDSPSTMFIEMASYVGDVLSFYVDRSIQENLLEYAVNADNIISLAYSLGYRPKVTSTALVDLDVYQQIPAIISASVASPDFSYALTVAKGASVRSNSNSNVYFITQNTVDFTFSSSYDPTDISVLTINSSTNQPDYYLLKKSVKAVAGTIKTQTYTFGAPVKFTSIQLPDNDIIEITDVTDADGNKWYEVPYLAQSTIFDEVPNNQLTNPFLANDSNSVPYLLTLKKVDKRFVTRFDASGLMTVYFGSGVSSSPDETIIPNSDNIGMGLIDSISKLNVAYDPSNFLYTGEYGQVPANTTLTFTYTVGGGVETNVPANDVNLINSITIDSANLNPSTLNQPLLQFVKNSLTFNNPNKASGGGSGDTIDDIRYKSMANYPTQLRNVTLDDLAIRCLSMPGKYGTVAKAYPMNDYSYNLNDNPFSISLYVLSYDSNKNLTQASQALKQNLKNYISQYKISNDGISIKDGYYINIGVNFSVTILPSYNSREVLSNCLLTLKDHFNIDNWQINQPIIITDIYNKLIKVKGVQSVVSINIVNKQGEQNGYSRFGYDIAGATKNGVVYPSLDPSIFEVRYPDIDINGQIANF